MDVDAMLDSLEPQQFDELIAFEQLSPMDSGWEQFAMQATITHNGFRDLIRMWAGVRAAPDRVYIKPEDLMPGPMRPEPAKSQSCRDVFSKLTRSGKLG